MTEQAEWDREMAEAREQQQPAKPRRCRCGAEIWHLFASTCGRQDCTVEEILAPLARWNRERQEIEK